MPESKNPSSQTHHNPFDRLRSLTDDWDGLGAAAPAHETIAYAERLAGELRSRGWPVFERAYALNSGEVVLEWSAGESHFEIEISSPGRVAWMRSRPGQPAKHGAAWSIEAANALANTLVDDMAFDSNPDGSRFETVGKALVTEMLIDELSKTNGAAESAFPRAPRDASFKIDMSKLLDNEIRRLMSAQHSEGTSTSRR